MKQARLIVLLAVFAVLSGLVAANSANDDSMGPNGLGLPHLAAANIQPWDGPLMPMFEKAAKIHDIPLPLLLALGYFGSAFENRGDAPTIENGYGVMALRENDVLDSLAEGTNLTKAAKTKVKINPWANINAAAAVLSSYAHQMGIDRSEGLDAWLDPVIKYAGLDEENSRFFAMEIYEKLLTGLDCTNSRGERFYFAPQDIGDIDLSDLRPADMGGRGPFNAAKSMSAGGGIGVLSADYGPAIWDPAASCNYSAYYTAKNTVVIHTIEGTAAGCRSWFKNCNAQVSAHYVTSEAGGVWQCVDEDYRAWHVGCANNYCIGIENEGYAGSPSHPQSLYDCAGLLTRDICNSWGIQKQHNGCPPGVLGHNDINNCVCGGTHWDPGGGWDWGYFMGVVVGAPPPPSYAAHYVGQSYPGTMVAGSTAVAWAEYMNDGTATWGHAATRLGTQNPQDRCSPFFESGNWINCGRPSEVDQSAVSTGQVGRFTFILRAPSTPGNYVEVFRPVQEGVTWFGGDVTWWITVTAATGNISGTVRNSVTSAGISGATVSIAGGGSTTTNGSGGYSFTGLNAGSYTLTASATGYGSSNAGVNVTAGQTATQDFSLTPTDTQAPSVPTNLAATPVLPTQINLSWTASTDNVGVTGYKVFRNGGQIATVGGTTYSDGGLAPNTGYSYEVSAYDAIGNESARCSAVNISTPPSEYVIDNPDATYTGAWTTASASTDKYGADYKFASTANNENKTAKFIPNLAAGGTFDVYAWWCVGTNRATNAPYTAYYSGGSQTVSVNQQVSGGTWNLLVTGKTFAAGTSGYLKLSNGTGATGKIVLADAARFVMTSVDAVPPSVPTGLAGNAVSMNQVDLTWNASTDNIQVSGYNIYRDSVLIGFSETLNYSDATCAPGTTYGYQAAAYDTAGNESAKCTAVNVTTPSDTVAPSVPTDLAGTAISPSQIDLTWTASTDNVGVAGYEIFRDGNQIGTSATASYSDTTCTIGTTYTYEVSAYDAIGNESAVSTAVEVTSLGNDSEAPTVPTNLQATAVSGTQVDLAWEGSTDNVGVTGYKVYRDGVQIGTSAMTTYSDTTCAEYTAYSYEVSAYDASSNESAKSTPAGVTTLDVTAPSVPANLAATAVSGTQVDLAWTASTDNVGVTGYKVFRNGVEIGTALTASYSDTTCAPATTYSYEVSAYDAAANESAKSTPANVTTPDTIAPSAPSALSATAISRTQVDLAWNASTDNVGVAGYKVFRNGQQIGTSGTTSYSDTTCSSHTTYTYEVCAYDTALNDSALSNQASATTPANTDIILDNDVVSLVGNWFTGTAATNKYGADYRYITSQPTETATATWTPVIDVAGYYTVSCWYPHGGNRSAAAPYTVQWDGGSQTVAVNQQVSGGQWVALVTNKRFQTGTAGYVRVGNGTNEGTLSIMADAVRFLLVSDDLTAPSVPTDLAAAAVSGTQINLTWTASTDNVGVAGYKIYRNDAEVGTSTTTSYSDTGLSGMTSYTYKVAAYDAMGNTSAQSSPASATTMDGQAPTVPTGVAASAVGPQRINISWTASTDNVGVTGYKIFRNGGFVGTSATTSYSDGGLAPNTAYTYTVSAYDAASNESAQSTGAGATTPGFAEIVMDNGAATIGGVWTTASAATDKYGADYIFASTAVSEGKTATWTPNVAYAGNYDIYAWWAQGSNRATNAPYFCQWNGGSQTVSVNQSTNGGGWRTLLTGVNFAAGTGSFVRLGNGTGATGKIVVADAVRYVQVSGN